ncbi:hypothetical protein [Mammaliicoccus sp. D-M17]|uniref:hypothetical protein n=1 Tax=Mammaliicoccus sp. D-M17 TaxID=2898677 RepID=UPI001EFB2C8A|nr:hypothetical protein [Mammaliicoccus sp. D-M17]
MTFSDTSDNTNQEKKEQSKSVKKNKEKSKKNSEKELKINNRQDLQEIIYSKKDEKTKMNAYNQAIEKDILPRSNNYQESVYAYEESVWLQNNSN